MSLWVLFCVSVAAEYLQDFTHVVLGLGYITSCRGWLMHPVRAPETCKRIWLVELSWAFEG